LSDDRTSEAGSIALTASSPPIPFLRHTEAPASAERKSHSTLAFRELQAMIDTLVEHVAVVGCDGTILAINRKWRREVERLELANFDVGHDYPSALESRIAEGDTRVAQILKAFDEVSKGTRESFRCIYIGSGALSGSDYNMTISGFEVAGKRHVLVSAQDLTEINRLKRQQRRLGSQILRAQEDERRRLARELHDSTSQLLVVLKLNLMGLEPGLGDAQSDAVIAECKQVVDEVQQQIRSLSFLAHPPALSSNNLEGALEGLTSSFASRTGLDIDLQTSDVGESSASVEAAVYRLAQEALANIHRHAAASRATIRLVGTQRYLHLMIVDDGIGFDASDQRARRSLGVGVVGMGERVRELGGRFSIRRTDTGTALMVSLPRRKSEISIGSVDE
jgi:two-component system, NarL family, sensor kinase